jgi:hypothetical protein
MHGCINAKNIIATSIMQLLNKNSKNFSFCVIRITGKIKE